MTFEIPKSKASKGQDQFKFKIGDTEFSVKKLKFLSLGAAEAIENPESVTVVLDLFGKAGTASGTAVRSLDKEQFEALVEAWQKDSEVSLGESAASSS